MRQKTTKLQGSLTLRENIRVGDCERSAGQQSRFAAGLRIDRRKL